MQYNKKRLIPRGLRREDGAFAEIRTPDQLIKSQLLYQLSYEGLILGTALKIMRLCRFASGKTQKGKKRRREDAQCVHSMCNAAVAARLFRLPEVPIPLRQRPCTGAILS
jgi:hypothetical protein